MDNLHSGSKQRDRQAYMDVGRIAERSEGL